MAVSKPQDLQSVRHHQALGLVVGWGDALKALEPLQSCCTALGLVGHHPASTRLYEHLPGEAPMLTSTTGQVLQSPLAAQESRRRNAGSG